MKKTVAGKCLSLILTAAIALNPAGVAGVSAYAAASGDQTGQEDGTLCANPETRAGDDGYPEPMAAECDHKYVAGKCIYCGDVLAAYKWYYDNEGEAEFTISDEGDASAAEELAALADIVDTYPYTWTSEEGPQTLGCAFENETINLESDADLSTLLRDEDGNNWIPIGGSGEKTELEISSQEELESALEAYFVIYDNEGDSYVKNSKDQATYVPGRTYYCVMGEAFAGTFDGNGHSITGMNIVTDMGYCGLFGDVSGTIRDFTIDGTIKDTAQNADYVGGACGKLSFGSAESGSGERAGCISRVTSTVTIDAYLAPTSGYQSDSGCYNVGGVVGFVGEPGGSFYTDEVQAVVEKSVYRGEEVAGMTRVGGIAGRNAGIIRECANFGTVFNGSGQKKGTGGITGMNGGNNAVTDSGLVEDCYNAGRVEGNNGYWTGGIAGFQNGASLVRNCYNSSDLGIYNTSGKAFSWSNPGVGQNEGTADKVYGIDTVKGSDWNASSQSGTTVGNSGGTSRDCDFVSADDMKKMGFYNALNTRRGDTASTGLWSFDSAADGEGTVNRGYVVLTWQVPDVVYGVNYCVDESIIADESKYMAPAGEAFVTTLTPAGGYSLREEDITVAVAGINGALKPEEAFIYEESAGTLTILGDYVTGDITISGESELNPGFVRVRTGTMANVSFDALPAAKLGEDYTVTLTPAEGYSLTADDITVTSGEVTLAAGEDYTYAPETGILTVNAGAFTDSLTISATATKDEPTPTPVPDTVEVTEGDMDNVTFEGSDTAVVGEPYTARLEPDEGYSLGAEDITVTVKDADGNARTLSAADGEYSYADGVLTITGSAITGNITVSATAAPKTFAVDATGLENAKLRGSETATYGREYSATIVADAYYDLPDSITVKADGEELGADTGYTYTVNTDGTAALAIPAGKVTGEIAVSGTATAKTFKENTPEVRNVDVEAITRGEPTYGEDYQARLTPQSGYELTPDDITVKAGDKELTPGVEYTYEGGILTICGDAITGDITIIATAKESSEPEPTPEPTPAAKGADTLCVRRGAVCYFSYTIRAGDADLETVYGRADDTVLFGDWNGDGIDTYCVRRGAGYYFRNSLTSGVADEIIVYGRADDEVLVGDWDGDGKDTLAVRRGRVYYLANSIKSGNADREVVYGRETDDVIAGDWDGDGKDTPAVRRGAQYFFRNTFTGGEAEETIVYGHADDVVLVGDWDGDGKDTLAVRRGAEYYFKNSISAGDADEVVVYGRAGDEVYAGKWK